MNRQIQEILLQETRDISLYRTLQCIRVHYDILNRLGATHECDR